MPTFSVCKWWYGAAEEMFWEGGEINMGQSKGSRQEAWVLSGGAACLLQGLCACPSPMCQGHWEESTGACKGSELRQSGSLAMFM